MLVLTRKAGEKIMIGDNITLTVVKTHGNRVQVGIDAPRSVEITRSELTEPLNRVSVAEADNPADQRGVAPVSCPG